MFLSSCECNENRSEQQTFSADGLCNTPTGASNLTAVEAGGVSGFV